MTKENEANEAWGRFMTEVSKLAPGSIERKEYISRYLATHQQLGSKHEHIIEEQQGKRFMA